MTTIKTVDIELARYLKERVCVTRMIFKIPIEVKATLWTRLAEEGWTVKASYPPEDKKAKSVAADLSKLIVIAERIDK